MEIHEIATIRRQLEPDAFIFRGEIANSTSSVNKVVRFEDGKLREYILKRPEEGEHLSRIINEQDILDGIDHPFIQHMEERGRVPSLYTAFAYVENVIFLEHVIDRKPEPVEYTVFKKIAQALEYLTQQGIVHRTINSEHVLIKDTGSPYLVGFGSAKYSGDNSVDIESLAILMLMGRNFEAYKVSGGEINVGEILEGEDPLYCDLVSSMLDRCKPGIDEIVIALDELEGTDGTTC